MLTSFLSASGCDFFMKVNGYLDVGVDASPVRSMWVLEEDEGPGHHAQVAHHLLLSLGQGLHVGEETCQATLKAPAQYSTSKV